MHLTNDILYYFQNNKVECDVESVINEISTIADKSECDRYSDIVYTVLEQVVDIIIDNCTEV